MGVRHSQGGKESNKIIILIETNVPLGLTENVILGAVARMVHLRGVEAAVG